MLKFAAPQNTGKLRIKQKLKMLATPLRMSLKVIIIDPFIDPTTSQSSNYLLINNLKIFGEEGLNKYIKISSFPPLYHLQNQPLTPSPFLLRISDMSFAALEGPKVLYLSVPKTARLLYQLD